MAGCWLLALSAWFFGRPAAATTLFGLVNTGEIYASTDQGTHWTVRAALPVRDAVALGAGATAARLFLATASGGLYASTDAGGSWTAVGAAPASDVVGLVITGNLTLYLLTASGSVYRSLDQGAHFAGLSAITGSDLVGLAQDSSTQYLYALGQAGEVWMSPDGGSTWSSPGSITVSDAVAVQEVAGLLDVLTNAGDLYQSSDAGTTWHAIGAISQMGMSALTHDQSTLLAGVGTGEVCASSDGRNWTWKGGTNQMTLRGLGVDTPNASGVHLPGLASGFALLSAGPNPARPGQALAINFSLTSASAMALELYDVCGRRVAEHVLAVAGTGAQTYQWQPGLRDGGAYFLRVRSGDGGTALEKVVVVP